MVQWVEHIVHWLRPIYEAMWEEMKAGGPANRSPPSTLAWHCCLNPGSHYGD
jgi:hypothetical protein